MKTTPKTTMTSALVSAEVAKLLHKLQGQIIKEASTHAPVPGEVVLLALGASNIEFSQVGNSVCMEVNGRGGARTRIWRDYQPSKTYPEGFKPGTWFGSEVRKDANGQSWERTVGRLVCNDFGDLVEVEA
jgi:hypothetical protein